VVGQVTATTASTEMVLAQVENAGREVLKHFPRRACTITAKRQFSPQESCRMLPAPSRLLPCTTRPPWDRWSRCPRTKARLLAAIRRCAGRPVLSRGGDSRLRPVTSCGDWEGEAPAEPHASTGFRLGRSHALPKRRASVFGCAEYTVTNLVCRVAESRIQIIPAEFLGIQRLQLVNRTLTNSSRLSIDCRKTFPAPDLHWPMSCLRANV